jgi:hypothetical protein
MTVPQIPEPLDAMERARILPSVTPQRDHAKWVLLFSTLAMMSWVLIDVVTWLGSLVNQSRVGLANIIVAYDHSIAVFPSAKVGWAWLVSRFILPVCLVGIALLKGRIRWILVVICTLTSLVPIGLSVKGGLPINWLVVLLSCLTMGFAVAAARFPRKATKLPMALAVAVLSLCAIVFMGLSTVRTSSDRKLGAATPEAAALNLVYAARDDDALKALGMIAPNERPKALKIGAALEAQRKNLARLKLALGLDGEPGKINIVSKEEQGEATIVKLAPEVRGAGSVIISILGGLPIATVRDHGKWYVSISLTLKALPGGS